MFKSSQLGFQLFLLRINFQHTPRSLAKCLPKEKNEISINILIHVISLYLELQISNLVILWFSILLLILFSLLCPSVRHQPFSSLFSFYSINRTSRNNEKEISCWLVQKLALTCKHFPIHSSCYTGKIVGGVVRVYMGRCSKRWRIEKIVDWAKLSPFYCIIVIMLRQFS